MIQVSKIRSLNGKKYVIYKINNHYFDTDEYMKNYLAIEKAISKNGGHISTVNLDEKGKKLLYNLANDVRGEESTGTFWVYNGVYYDFQKEKVCSLNNENIDSEVSVKKIIPVR